MSPKAKPLTSIYQLTITLKWLEPPIWRQVLVQADITLAMLHRIIQAVMGWEDAHLHQFTVGNQIYGEPTPDDGFFGGGASIKDERKAKLNRVAPMERTGFLYEYDFGDGWVHEVVIENILEAEAGKTYPLCTAGERACPPEDCGGPPGYEGLLEVLADPSHSEHEEIRDWLGEDGYDPESFDWGKANSALQRLH